MNHLKTAICILFISFGTFLNAQELLSSVPKKAEDYKATEGKAIATINWLENTPTNTEVEKRKEQSGLFISLGEWLANGDHFFERLCNGLLRKE